MFATFFMRVRIGSSSWLKTSFGFQLRPRAIILRSRVCTKPPSIDFYEYGYPSPPDGGPPPGIPRHPPGNPRAPLGNPRANGQPLGNPQAFLALFVPSAYGCVWYEFVCVLECVRVCLRVMWVCSAVVGRVCATAVR